LWRLQKQDSKGCTSRRLLAGHSGEDAEFGEKDNVGVRNFAVVDDLSVAAAFGGVAFDIEDDIRFVFGSSRVLQRDEEFRGIKMDAQLMRAAGTADAQVAHQRLFADHRFFASDLIPLFAFVLHGGRDAIPNNAAEADGGFVVEFGLLRFEILTEFFREVFLS